MPMSDSYPPFRRLTDPVLVPVGPTASNQAVPELPKEATAFYVVNANLCYVRLRGTRGHAPLPVEEGKGWLFPPGHAAVYSSQMPNLMSAMAVERPGYPLAGLTFVPLEVSYGTGT